MQISLMPLTIALVSTCAAIFVNNTQEYNAREKAIADRQIKIIEIFSDKITSPDQKQRIIGLRFLSVLDNDLAAKLAKVVSQNESETPVVREVAEKVAAEATARARLLPRVYVHIASDDQRLGARAISDKLASEGFVVPGIERVGNRAPKATQLRYFRKAEAGEAGEIVETLKTFGADAKPELIGGYENSEAIRPMHFELWFAPGQPAIKSTAGTTS